MMYTTLNIYEHCLTLSYYLIMGEGIFKIKLDFLWLKISPWNKVEVVGLVSKAREILNYTKNRIEFPFLWIFCVWLTLAFAAPPLLCIQPVIFWLLLTVLKQINSIIFQTFLKDSYQNLSKNEEEWITMERIFVIEKRKVLNWFLSSPCKIIHAFLSTGVPLRAYKRLKFVVYIM